MQLAIMTDDEPRKKELLRDCRAKFNLAIKVNSDAITPDGQLAISLPATEKWARATSADGSLTDVTFLRLSWRKGGASAGTLIRRSPAGKKRKMPMGQQERSRASKGSAREGI